MTAHACASCGTSNEADARFCEGCGTALDRSCGACGVAVSASARFCKGCGAPLGAEFRPAAVEGPTRKTVTVLFADLAGSTAFEEIVDAETARDVIGRYHELLRSTVERHRVGVTKYIGDGFMAVWGVPEIGADDAGNAVDAAVELQERFVGLARQVAEAHRVELALRVAVNTGEVVVGADDADLVGDALNVGARLESECPHGHVVVGEETWRSTRGRHRYEPLGAVQVKGRQAAVAVYKWLGHHSEPTDAITFVGRGDELQRLRMVFDNAVAARTARLVTVTGDPGVGKTRLAAEFAGSLPGARVIEVRCAVEGSPALAPVVEVLRPRDLDAEIPADVAERDRLLRDLTGMTAGVPGSVEETFWALRRFVEVLATDAPVVIVIDDIQWADSLLLDLIEHLAEWVRGVPVLMIALARPELRETRPDLVTVGGWVTEAVRLRGLEARATAELAGRVLGSDRLPEELLRRLPTSTGGNPLFVRELVGMLVHDGVLAPKPDGWRLTVDADDIAVPPTIQALLASRLERLKSADRRVLEVASVIGTDFAASAVSRLAGLREAEITSALNRLRRLDLAQPSGTYAGDEAVWRFHHVLIRDVAYRRLLKSERADLHERLADWVEAGGTNLAFESDEVVARNLEAAQSYRLDLGLRDAHTSELALRSARSYLSSARRALDRDELVSAGTQAARGAALAAGDTALHAELLLVGCEAFLSAGDVAAGSPLVDDLERIAGEALAPWAICYRCQLVVYTDPSRLLEVDERLQGAIDEFTRRADAAGLAKAHRVRAGARARMGRVGDSEIDLFEALIAARRGGDHRQITAALGAAPNAALWGPSPAPKAGGRCLDVVRMQRMTTAAPSLEATSLRCLAVLELLRGRPDKARSMLADARQVVADLGLRHGLMETELFAGIIEMMVGDAVAAEPHFRTALEGLDALGVGADAGQAAALLARSVLAQGRIDEADRYAAESERIAGHNLKTAIAWRAVRGEILAAQGQFEAAIVKAREAVTVAADTDLVLDHADACLALSRVLAAAGDLLAAARARSDAESLYAAKDAVFLVGRTAEAVRVSSTQPPAEPTTSRLTVRNRATATADAAGRAMQAHDAGAAVALFSGGVVHDDHRRMRGNPIVGIDGLSLAVHQRIAQYPYVEWRHLAVRGETLELARFQWRDEAGNTSTSLDLFEVGHDDLIVYHARFDEDDFEAACRELEKRYYTGEGAPFAENGRTVCTWMDAVARRDVEAARRVSWPDFRWFASPSSLKPEERTVDQFFDWLDERAQQLLSMRAWPATIQWLSPNCFVTLNEIQGAGTGGDEYLWEWIHVGEYRDGLAVSVREFDVEDEDAAFAYAESLVAPKSRRLAVANAASRVADRLLAALQANDAGAAIDQYSTGITYEDRRPLAGALITAIDYVREVVCALLAQYDHFQGHTLAIRGDRLCLFWNRWSDDTGNQATNLHVIELGDDGLIASLLYFDEDDFQAAYRELESRYYAGEGAAYANHGRTQSAFVEAMNQLDVAAARQLCQPHFRWLSAPTTLATPVRTVDDLVTWWRERAEQVGSVQYWNSTITWLSPEILISAGEARGISSDGAEYAWSGGIYAGTFRDGLLESVCAFELEDEDAAFAFAESLVAQRTSRLAVSNAASRVADQAMDALQANDARAVNDLFSTHIIYEGRRPFAGALSTGIDYLSETVPALLTQYDHFNGHVLAVRGDRLSLTWSRWSDDTGNESKNLHLVELGEDGLIARYLYFDEDDFWAAYGELENRYYAGEGAAYAESGLPSADWVIAISNADIEGVRRVSHPDFRWIATPSALKDGVRTVDDMFRWMQARGRQVSSQRHWVRILHWLSPNCAVGLGEMTAIGDDGEKYDWNSIYVAECRDGLLATVREFDDEQAAFAYAEGLVARQPNRLALSNSASRIADAIFDAMRANDADTAIGLRSQNLIYDDRRRIAGALMGDIEHLRAGVAMVLAQYKHFENRTLAVRGERLWLGWSRWSDSAGNEAVHLHVLELGADGLIAYECRFDEGDFEAAYSELERRYYAGEGKPYAEERMHAASSRLAVKNRASAVAQRVPRAVFDERDLDAAVALFSDQFVYEDRRGLTGDPIVDTDALRAALGNISRQYSRYDVSLLAVRGERLMLARGIWSDEAGNQSNVLLVLETDDDDRIVCHVAFDEDNFDSAYRELERRYYSGEGSEFAEQGRTSVSFLAAMDSLDVEAARCVCAPNFRWLTPPSTLVAQERSLDEFFGWLRERADQVSSVKNFGSVIRWLSPTCFVALGNVRARGTDGEEYTWARIYVGEFRGGLLASMRQFDDEESAFAYAEMRLQVAASRLAVTNDASVTAESLLCAMQSHDVEAVLGVVSDDICFDDYRRLSGDPIHGKADARVAIQRILKQFNHFEFRMLAVRGDLLALYRSRWFDDSGNETTYLHVVEVGDDGRIVTDARFDEDDFDSAVQELERRYYSGEGAAFAESGKAAAEIVRAGTAGDLNRVFGELASPGLRVESRSRTIVPDRTAAELRDSIELFSAMVSSSQTWYSALHWLSPNCVVARQEREAVGNDGERYEWSRIYVGEFEHGVLTATCEFDVEFEEQAFAYAEERIRADTSRLAVSNRASETALALIADLNANDIDGAVAQYSEQVVYTDRRPIGGALVTDFASIELGVEAARRQYSQFEGRTLAVRGDNLALGWSRFCDESGNLTEAFELLEVGDGGRIIFNATFAEDDFESAYRALEERYYAGEGAEFAESGLVMAEYITVKNRGDLDTLFRDLSTPDVHIDSRSRSVLLDRSAAEFRASLEELGRLVGSLRDWLSAVQWISPTWFLARYEREAVGQEDQTYEWSRIVVGEIRHGRLASACQFELADEDAAFAYIEEQVRITANPLAVTNRASELSGSLMRAMQAGEIDIALNHFSNDYVFDDHRRLSGDPIPGKVELRAAAERILQQFSRFERRVLAVRGKRLSLAWSRWCDAAGNETSYLHVYELGDDDLIARDIRFDENDFEGAYRELEGRYYAGEGAEFRENGGFTTEYIMTMNRGDFDTMFNELTSADLHFDNRARSVFAAPSGAELRAHFEDLYAMLASVRSWFSALHWVSPTVQVGRLEREGLGHDGERFAWTWLLVNEYRDERLASICEFDEENDDAALAYAEELARQT